VPAQHSAFADSLDALGWCRAYADDVAVVYLPPVISLKTSPQIQQ
jgi:hypothetical protein